MLVLSCSISWADEKKETPPKNTPIRVTGGASNSTTPTPATPDRSTDGGIFDLLRKQTSGAGDVEIPMSQPSRNRPTSRQLQDLIDRQNWIFQKPQDSSNDTFNQGKGPEEMFNLDNEPGGSSRKASKVFENFWNEGNSKPAAKPAASALAADAAKTDQHSEKSFGAPGALDTRGTSITGTKIEPMNWNTLFGQQDKPDSATAAARELYGTTLVPNGNLPSALSTGTSLPEFSSKSKPAADEFSPLFKNSSPKLLTSSPNDPINSALDSSTQDLNPVIGRRLNDAAKGIKSLDSLPLFRGNNLPLASFSPGSLGELNAKIAEQESQRPAFASQPETKAIKTRPAVLEFPKRNF
ncbi:MAG: hypothetical protein HY043_09420 [Verrucomicrobia bacterium]|nr:hypothetical protein [Verrucomicrobiota bacterium]